MLDDMMAFMFTRYYQGKTKVREMENLLGDLSRTLAFLVKLTKQITEICGPEGCLHKRRKKGSL